LVYKFFQRVGVSSLVGTGLLAFALVGRMHGREDIEWQDRSWRLLENRGQTRADDWSVGGATAALLIAAWRKELRHLGWKGGLGLVGMGSLSGTIAMLLLHGFG